MGICLHTSAHPTETDSPVFKVPVKFGKKQKALLELIVLNRNKVHRRLTDLSETVISSPLSITVINLNFIRLDPVSCQHLAALFPLCPNLSTLNLWKCKLGDRGVGLLSKTLSGLRQLEVLVLDDNALGIPGAEQLSECLLNLSNLRHFCCRSNELQCEGVTRLAEKMGYLKCVTVLTLDDNDMTSYGLEHLLYNLNLSKLERLGLSYDRITDCGVLSLIQYAGMMRNLETLDFKGNLVNTAVAEKMQKAFPNVKIE